MSERCLEDPVACKGRAGDNLIEMTTVRLVSRR